MLVISEKPVWPVRRKGFGDKTFEETFFEWHGEFGDDASDIGSVSENENFEPEHDTVSEFSSESTETELHDENNADIEVTNKKFFMEKTVLDGVPLRLFQYHELENIV